MRKQALLFKNFSCFLCGALFLFAGRFPTVAEGKEKNLPLGEMISRGEVKFEARENIWKEVEPSFFPVLPGAKIKTEKGASTLFLGAHHKVEMGQNSLICVEQKDRLRLYRGRVDFRLSGQKDLSFRAGNLIVIGNLPLQASKSAKITAKAEEARGSLLLHGNGSLRIRGEQGQIAVLSQERKVLAVLSPKETLTIPFPLVEGPAGEKTLPVRMAQVGDEEAADQPVKSGGLSAKTWGVIGLAALAVGGVLAIGGGGGGGGGAAPVCP